jgi:hypothetical protein
MRRRAGCRRLKKIKKLKILFEESETGFSLPFGEG